MTPSPYRRRRRFRPVKVRTYFDVGRVAEVDVIVCTPRRWAARPESRTGKWNAVGVTGGLVVAVRLTL